MGTLACVGNALYVCLSVLMMVFVHWSKQIQISLVTMDREWNCHIVRSVGVLQSTMTGGRLSFNIGACGHIVRNTPDGATLDSLLSTFPIW